MSRNLGRFRYLLCFLGIALALPGLGLVALATVTPITLSGIIYLIGYGLLVTGLILSPWRPKYQRIVLIGGVVPIGLVAGVRVSSGLQQASHIKDSVLPSATETRWVNWLIDEQDSVSFGEGLLHLIGGVTEREHAGLVAALSTGYAQANLASGAFPSPVVSTYLGLQKPSAFDAVVIEPDVERPTPIGVVFLHGYMGNVTLQCWQIAQAVEQIGAVTVCPSTNWSGEWWQPDGTPIIRATLSYLRERGIQQFYVGGFSNGGYGLGRLSTVLATESGLKGLFFIAGVSNEPAVRATGLPVLVIQGFDDERMPVGLARQFVAELGEQATYVELEADHFLIIKQSKQLQEGLGTWLKKLADH